MSRVNPFIYLYIGVALLVCERGGILGMSPLSQTSKATPMYRYINGLTLDITVKTDV